MIAITHPARRAGSIVVLTVLLQAAFASEPDPLFAAESIVEIAIEAPFARIMTERPNEEYVPATLRVAGSDAAFDIGIRTRGQHRRKVHICPFAPLRLNFKQEQTPDTLFANQDKLKLVTHCRDSSEHYEQAVLTEYLAYRILNVMTDKSYRVRRLNINYVYTDADRSVTKPAFVIEADDRLSERLALPFFVTEEVDAAALDPAYTNLTSVFQFLIGNTDFSPVRGRKGEECCHNHTPMGPAAGGSYYSIPYDFDMAGIVNRSASGCIGAAVSTTTISQSRSRDSRSSGP